MKFDGSIVPGSWSGINKLTHFLVTTPISLSFERETGDTVLAAVRRHISVSG